MKLTRAEILTKVTTIVVEQLGVKPEDVTEKKQFYGPGDNGTDLGCDSLDTIELVMAAEEEFGIDISDLEAEALKTVGQAVDFIEAQQRA